jgi:hypothetical protein
LHRNREQLSSAGQLAQPCQRSTCQRPGKVRGRHFAAEPYRLPGPKAGKIDLAELLRRGLQGRQARRGMGKRRRISRNRADLAHHPVGTPRAGRPVMTLVMTVESSRA